MRNLSNAKGRRGRRGRRGRHKRRSMIDFVRLKSKVMVACARSPRGVSMQSLSRRLRQGARVLGSVVRAAVLDGALVSRGRGRAALFYAASSAPSSTLLDEFIIMAGSIDRASRLIGVDRRTLYRWRRGGTLPDFQKLRITALLKEGPKSSGRGNSLATHARSAAR